MKCLFFLRRSCFFAIFLFCQICFCQIYAESGIEKGVDFIKNHKPENAIAILYKEVSEPNANPKAYLYLGFACLQVGKYSDAITWLNKGKVLDYTDKYLYSYNLGNAYFMQNLFDQAKVSYDDAISLSPNFAPALLNRANTAMKMEDHNNALIDYKSYLAVSPNSQQRSSIERIVALLENQKTEAEMVRLKAEAERQAQLQREQELLDNVNSSLISADNAESVSAGSEDTIDYSEEEGDLE